MKSTFAITSTILNESSPKQWTPHKYQKTAVKFLIGRAAAALFLDPGLGKTSIAYGALKILMKKGFIKRALIIAPRRPCYAVWPKELKKWADFNGFTIDILHGPYKDEALERRADINVINPEGLPWLLRAYWKAINSGSTDPKDAAINPDDMLDRSGREIKRPKHRLVTDVKGFKKLGYDALIIDELSKFKNKTGLRSKILHSVLHTFKYRWGLTGSPAPNGLLDVFGQVYCLDMGKHLGQFITHFRSEYFQAPHGLSRKYKILPGAEKKIYKKVAPVVLRMSAEDYLDMPQLIFNDVVVEMPDEACRIYAELEEELITQIAENKIIASNAGVAAQKCHQLANGSLFKEQAYVDGRPLFRPGKRPYFDIHDAKFEALDDLIDELQGSPLLIGYWYRHELDKFRKRYGKDIPHIGSDTSDREFLKLERAWNNNELPFLLGQPASMGHGLNLQDGDGHHVALFSLLYDFELYDQFFRRLYRQGNKSKKVFVHHFISAGTVDLLIRRALKQKDKCQQDFFDALVELAKTRKGSTHAKSKAPARKKNKSLS